MSIDEPVHLVGLPGETWMNRLDSLLDSLDLTWMPAGDGIEISDTDSARSNIGCLYFLPSSLAIYRQELISSIERDVTPNMWESNSGMSSITMISATSDTLGVRASMKTHLRLRRYLLALERYSVKWCTASHRSARDLYQPIATWGILTAHPKKISTVRLSQLKGND